MKYENKFDANEVLEAVVADIAELLAVKDSEKIGMLKNIFANGALQVARIELEYNEDGAPFSVEDEIKCYL